MCVALVISLLLLTALCFGMVGYVASPLDLYLIQEPLGFLELILKGHDDLIAYGEDVSAIYYVIPMLIYELIGRLDVPLTHFTFAWHLWWLIVGMCGYFFFFAMLLAKEREKGNHLASHDNVILCSLFAVLNFFVITRFEDCFGFIPHFVAPWLLLSVVLLGMKRYRIGIAVLFLASQFNTTQLTYNCINLLFLAAFALYQISWRAALILVLTSIASAFWMWGSVIYIAIWPSDTLSFAALNEDFLFYSRHSTVLEILSLSGNWADITGATRIGNVVYGRTILRLVLLLPLAVLVWLVATSKYEQKHYLSAIGVVALIAVGAHPTSPLGPIINSLGYEFFPIMVFRNTQKFVGALVILMAIFFAVSINRRQRTLIWIYVYTMAAIVFVVGFHPPTHRIKEIPAYWYDARQHVEDVPGDGNILLTPFAAVNHYDWNAYNAFRYAIPFKPPQPVLFKSLAHPNNAVIEKIERKMAAGLLCSALQEHDIYMIIDRADVITNSHVAIEPGDCVNKSTRFGPVTVYEISGP